MMRLIASCVWLIAATSVSVYVTATWNSRGAEVPAPVNKTGSLERIKIAPVNVPMIANGNVQGYIVAQFVYFADRNSLQELTVPPGDFITDEVFRTLYTSTVDFNRLERYDLQSLTSMLPQKVNQRLGREIIKDVLVVEFNYVPKREIAK
ncbi:MAG: hypothetical protein L0Y60_09840 [Beijerinckiaceae bacterium]|nr:hypothetical protein [Acidobacteriota bacterium]MCI0599806.1 hypothetical protein [Beijerinckiaceae bacterium]